MTISINDNFPNQELRILIDGEVQNVNSADYFSGKKIVLQTYKRIYTCNECKGYSIWNQCECNGDSRYNVIFWIANEVVEE